jgi:hypothetical protein
MAHQPLKRLADLIWRKLNERQGASGGSVAGTRRTGPGPDLAHLRQQAQLIGRVSEPNLPSAGRHSQVIGTRLRLTNQLALDSPGRGSTFFGPRLLREYDHEQVSCDGHWGTRTATSPAQNTVHRRRKGSGGDLGRILRSDRSHGVQACLRGIYPSRCGRGSRPKTIRPRSSGIISPNTVGYRSAITCRGGIRPGELAEAVGFRGCRVDAVDRLAIWKVGYPAIGGLS